MGNLGAMMRRILLTAVLAAVATPAIADDGIAQGLVPGRTPASVLETMTRNCMTARFLIEQSTPNSIVCSKVATGGRGFAAQLLLGNSYSTPPQDKIRITAVAVGADTQIQIQHTIETQMAFGQVRSYPGGGKDLQKMLDSMIERTKQEPIERAAEAKRADDALKSLDNGLPRLPSERP